MNVKPLALKVDLPSLQCLPHDRGVLGKMLQWFFERNAENSFNRRLVAGTEAKAEATRRELTHHERPLSGDDRMARKRRSDRCAQKNPLGLRRRDRKDGDSVGTGA